MEVINGGMESRKDRILIVDDSPDILSISEAILASAGYEVIAYTNGLIAMQIMNLMPPDLMILDITMPHIDGYDMTRRVRSNPDWNHIPILLFSALDRSQVVLGLECGADDILGKPIKIEQLLAKVNLLLHSSHRQQLRAG